MREHGHVNASNGRVNAGVCMCVCWPGAPCGRHNRVTADLTHAADGVALRLVLNVNVDGIHDSAV